MLRSAIIDDEQGSRDTLSALLARYCPNVEVVAVADSIQSAFSAIRTHRPDVIFLDIQMPHGSGFDLIEEAHDHNCEVILTTAYDQYAIKAVRAAALDYLLKPIDIEELITAVQRAEKQVGDRRLRGAARAYAAAVPERGRRPTRIALPTLDDLIFIQVGDIVRCEATGNYTVFHLVHGESHVTSRTLKEYETMLEDADFFRVHHSHLVNLDHVRKYVRGDGGAIVMLDGAEVPVARRRKDELLMRLSRL
jgi:two-component system LytT family response regulator